MKTRDRIVEVLAKYNATLPAPALDALILAMERITDSPKCPQCGDAATYQTPDGAYWDGNAHTWRVAPLQKRPVAFAIKRAIGGFDFYLDEAEAARHAEVAHVEYHGLYLRDGN